jgi:hypothetical protein
LVFPQPVKAGPFREARFSSSLLSRALRLVFNCKGESGEVFAAKNMVDPGAVCVKGTIMRVILLVALAI